MRPDGNETYVQNGWLRASHRKLDAKHSTATDPVPTHLKRDAAPLPKGRFTLVRVPLFAVAHAFRAGSRIRVTIQAPGGDRPRWDFASVDKGRTTNTIGLGGALASRLVLPVLAGVSADGTPLPGPTALRGEPNRLYVRGRERRLTGRTRPEPEMQKAGARPAFQLRCRSGRRGARSAASKNELRFGCQTLRSGGLSSSMDGPSDGSRRTPAAASEGTVAPPPATLINLSGRRCGRTR